MRHIRHLSFIVDNLRFLDILLNFSKIQNMIMRICIDTEHSEHVTSELQRL